MKNKVIPASARASAIKRGRDEVEGRPGVDEAACIGVGEEIEVGMGVGGVGDGGPVVVGDSNEIEAARSASSCGPGSIPLSSST